MDNNTPAIDALLSQSNTPTPVSPSVNPIQSDTPAIDNLLIQDKRSTLPQQALTGLEGLAQGVVGPLAPAAEVASGLTTGQDIRERQQVNPITHDVGEATGFIGSVLTPGLGEASLAGKVGKVGEVAGGIAPLAPKLVQTGIKAGAELAALSASNELSKLVESDPDQTLGTAAVNIGLSGLIGGVGGPVLGSVSPLFKTTANKLGLTKLASDFMGEMKLLQDAPDLVQGANEELAQRKAEAEYIPKKIIQGPIPGLPPKPGTPLYAEDTKELLTSTQKLADRAAKEALDSGQDIPSEALLNPTPILNSQAGIKPSPGQQLARWAYENGSNTLSKALGDTAGAGLGSLSASLTGTPLVGAYIGKNALGPILSTLVKPLAETALNSDALRVAVDTLHNVIKGQSLLTTTVDNIFKSGSQVLAKNLIPTQESRDKLEKSISYFHNPDNAINVGGQVGHYLPSLGGAIGATTATAVNYLDGLRPKATPVNPFDTTPPVSKQSLFAYNRALDIAQQPLLVLQHVKDGTLQAQDVQALNTIYPGLHKAIIGKVSDGLIKQQAEGKKVPYSQRQALSLLIGSPLDSTMSVQSAQAVIHSALPAQPSSQGSSSPSRKAGATGAQLKAISKSSNLYTTDTQQRQVDKRK